MKRFWLCFFILFSPVLVYASTLEKNRSLEGIYGNAGHLGISFGIGLDTFDYKYSRNFSSLDYVFRNTSQRVKPKAMITYFTTDQNRYSFLLEANIDLSPSSIKYHSFSFGIIDNLYLSEQFSLDFGLITVFEGSYSFFLTTGVSYYFLRTRNYYLLISDSFNFLLNSFNISNTFYFSWMYIF